MAHKHLTKYKEIVIESKIKNELEHETESRLNIQGTHRTISKFSTFMNFIILLPEIVKHDIPKTIIQNKYEKRIETIVETLKIFTKRNSSRFDKSYLDKEVLEVYEVIFLNNFESENSKEIIETFELFINCLKNSGRLLDYNLLKKFDSDVSAGKFLSYFIETKVDDKYGLTVTSIRNGQTKRFFELIDNEQFSKDNPGFKSTYDGFFEVLNYYYLKCKENFKNYKPNKQKINLKEAFDYLNTTFNLMAQKYNISEKELLENYYKEKNN